MPAARALVAPPATEKQFDVFGNVALTRREAGNLIDEKTCSWYLPSLEASCAKFQGFLLFAQGKNKEALKQFQRIQELDPETKLDERTHPSDLTRLRWGAEHGYLYAMPEELALYSGRQRFAVLLGDFYYVTQDFDRFHKIFRRLLDGEFGILSNDKIAYPQLAYATSVYWTESRTKAFDEYMKVIPYKNTVSARRATIALGNLISHVDGERAKQGFSLLEKLASSEVSEWTYQARITLAAQLMAMPGQRSKAVQVLKSIPIGAVEWHHIASAYLKALENE